MTQHGLARRIGVAGGERVSRWELGASEPRPDILVRLSDVLGVRPQDLVRLEGSGPDLRALRYALGLTAEKLAKTVGVSTSTYLRWESGGWERLPSQANLDALTHALHVTDADVLAAFERSQGAHRTGG
jgi:transcriptional regulator with XRE-family HTH domain